MLGLDAVGLARLQFAATACYHFLFVPLSIGMGLIMAIMQTRAYRTRDVHDEALARFWVRIFAVTFAVGVASGITMEFSFGTNWADYSRFVGNIFGAPLAAEALFAFFLESVFLGILLFGEGHVGRRFLVVSSWLVWCGSALSALWILIANSWMQTPAGYEVVDGVAVLTSFFEAAANYSTLQRYLHTVIALLIAGAFVCLAIGAYYRLKGRDAKFADRLLRVGFAVALVSTVVMMPAAHMQASEVAEEQPAKLAAMEGQYESGPVALSLFGWVDEDGETTYALSIPGGTSFLAASDFSAVYPGINDFATEDQPQGINAIFQSYHLMVALFGIIVLVLIISFLVVRGRLAGKKWPLRILQFSWIAPMLAIEMGWLVAEMGRQPWIVYGELRTADAVSLAVPAGQIALTLVLFTLIYLVIFIGWLRILLKTIKRGPEAFLPSGSSEVEGSVSPASGSQRDGSIWATASAEAQTAAGEVSGR